MLLWPGLRSAHSMSEIRTKAEKVPELKQAWITSVEPIIQLLRHRTERMTLKDVPFQTHDAAPEEVVQALERQVQADIDPNISCAHYLQKDLSSKAEYQRFLKEHCIERHYVFQIRKCDKPECCRLKRGPDVPRRPDPVLSNDNKHFKQFDKVLGQDTTDSDRPSAKNTNVTAVAEQLQGVKNSVLTGQNVRKTVTCIECTKPRCVSAQKALNFRESRTLTRQLEKYDYTCGALIAPEGDVLHGKVFVRLQLSCSSPIELAYYATTMNVRKDVCSFCAAENAQKDPALVLKYRVVLPLCQACNTAGKETLKRNPIKT
ncbi:uncharacterized protein LOC128548073 [Mercenaria mercenaria]|uniref:uncharacterized protein LOC128548073 n=1 Tax=Mercenaria mercenaria TaxID=6596 RepID=UPI00234EB8DA|nr:uncharacterized protein LOC128548073 [Mercenaria mercenaria]